MELETYRQLTYKSLLCIAWLLYWLDSTDYHLLLWSCTENSLVQLHFSEFIQMQQVQREKGMNNDSSYNLISTHHVPGSLLMHLYLLSAYCAKRWYSNKQDRWKSTLVELTVYFPSVFTLPHNNLIRLVVIIPNLQMRK